MKITKYVSPSEYQKHKKRESNGLEPVEFETKAVDMNYAYVPMGPMTQKAKESDEHLKKAAECNAVRFGLSEGGEHY